MSTIINDIAPRNQFIATNLQTVFDASFTADIATDVTVYARATGVAADDVAQVIAAVDYTVTFVGAERIVRVTFNVGRTTADIVTISRETPTNRMNLYTATNFTPVMLNQDFEVTTLTQQQNKLFRDKIGPQYNVSASLGLENIATYAGATAQTDLILPFLEPDFGWTKNTAGSEIVATSIPSQGAAPNDATYITQTPDSFLTNEQALSSLTTGFMSSTTATGVVATRTLTGTGNEIDITNGNGSGDPTFSLSATLDTPGTFTIGTSVVISAIINDSTQAAALATNISSALAMKTYIDNSFTTKVPLTTKGDLLGYNTGNARVPIGTVNGQMLQVASGDALGLAWSTASYPATATNAGRILRSDGTNYVDSTSTFADTYAASTLLYSNTANTVEGLATANSALLVTDASGVPAMTSSLTNGQIIIGSTGATPAVSTLTAGTGITIGNTAGTITISTGGAGYSWTEITGTTQAMVASNGYILNNAGLVTATLPATSSIGDTLILQGKGAGLYRIAQNAGQTIHFGSSDTTTGVGGYLEATNRYDSIELVCITANTDWAVLSGPQGSITIV